MSTDTISLSRERLASSTLNLTIYTKVILAVCMLRYCMYAKILKLINIRLLCTTIKST